jgi:hypothetical protein
VLRDGLEEEKRKGLIGDNEHLPERVTVRVQSVAEWSFLPSTT